MKRKNVALRIVNFLREHDGIREIIQAKLAKQIGCHRNAVYTNLKRLKEACVITEVDEKENLYFLNEKFLFIAEVVVEYISKYPEGAPINAGVFAQSKGVSLALLGIVLQKLVDLRVFCIKENSKVLGPPEYTLLEKDEEVWRSLFEPLKSFSIGTKEVFEICKEDIETQSGADHLVCEKKYNKVLNDAVVAQDLAIRFGEETQKAKAELVKIKEHNKALQSANDELRQKLHAKEQEMKFVERSNDELTNRSQKNQERLAELQKSASV